MKKTKIREFDPEVKLLDLDLGYQRCRGLDYDDEKPICFNPNRVELYKTEIRSKFLGGYKTHRAHDYMLWFHKLNIEYSPRDGTIGLHTDRDQISTSLTIGSQDPSVLRKLAEFLLEVADHEEHNFEHREPFNCWGSPSGATVRKTPPTEYMHFYPETVVTNNAEKRYPRREGLK
jgi:hypothetical protein